MKLFNHRKLYEKDSLSLDEIGDNPIDFFKKWFKEAEKSDRVIDFLFQMHIAQEDTKFGLSDYELKGILENEEYSSLNNVRCKGLMGMSTNTQDNNQVTSEFTALKATYDMYATEYNFDILSMGMSSDYLVAIVNGSTMIRVGSKIFQ